VGNLLVELKCPREIVWIHENTFDSRLGLTAREVAALILTLDWGRGEARQKHNLAHDAVAAYVEGFLETCLRTEFPEILKLIGGEMGSASRIFTER